MGMWDEDEQVVRVDATPLMMELVNRIEALSATIGALDAQVKVSDQMIASLEQAIELAQEAEGKFMADQLTKLAEDGRAAARLNQIRKVED